MDLGQRLAGEDQRLEGARQVIDRRWASVALLKLLTHGAETRRDFHMGPVVCADVCGGGWFSHGNATVTVRETEPPKAPPSATETKRHFGIQPRTPTLSPSPVSVAQLLRREVFGFACGSYRFKVKSESDSDKGALNWCTVEKDNHLLPAMFHDRDMEREKPDR